MSLFNKQHSNKQADSNQPQEQQMANNQQPNPNMMPNQAMNNNNYGGASQQTQQMPVQDPNLAMNQQTQQMPVQNPNNVALNQQTQQMPVQDPNAALNQQTQQMPVQDPNASMGQPTQQMPVQNPPVDDQNAPQANNSGYFQDVAEYPVQNPTAQNNDTNLYHSSNFNKPNVTVNEVTEKTASKNTGWDQWRQTEEQLTNLKSEQQELKHVLKGQLLSSRTFYHQTLQRKQESDDPYAQNVNYDLQQIQQINDSLKRWFGTDAISGEVMFEKGQQYLVLEERLAQPDDESTDDLANLNFYLDSFHVLPNLVTLNFDEELAANWQDNLDAGVVNPESQLLNLYQYFQTEADAKANVKRSGMGIEISPHARVETDSQQNIDRIYERDSLVMKVVKDEDGQPANIYHYYNGQLLSLDYLNEAGINLVTEFFDSRAKDQLLRKNFYRLDGTLAVILNYQESQPRVQIFNHNNSLVQAFETEQDFAAWWLVNKVLNDKTTIIVPLSSPVCMILLEYPDANYQVMPYIDDVKQQQTEVSQLLPLTERLSAGILVKSADDQKRLSELTQGQVNVSIVNADDEQ